MKSITLTILFSFVFSLSSIFSQTKSQDFSNWDELPPEFTNQYIERTFVPHVPDVSNRDSTNWSEAVDQVWGTGPSTEQKLLVFNQYWQTIDKHFACFQGIEDKWQELRDLYLPEIEQGVSRGRFAAIMDQLSLSLREPHTHPRDQFLHNTTLLVPGVPLMVVGGWGNNNHFGAGLTPLEDNTLLVYDVWTSHPINNTHPLELELGDRVLGYDGVMWKDCYPQLLEAEIPITGRWWGGSPSSFHHSFMMAAGLNWHLFDTIDIVRYETGDTVHLPTSLLQNANMNLYCSEQMDIPGVPKPNINAQEAMDFGTMQEGDKTIGYIYGWIWEWNAHAEFLEAVEALWDTDALIIDFRMNFGGNMFLSDGALELLFDEYTPTVGGAYRCDLEDHLGLCDLNSSTNYGIGSAPDGYNKPIAMLVGPGALSSGDQVALRMQYHPMVRTFGKSTSTAFNGPTAIAFAGNQWNGRVAFTEFFELSDPTDYLTHNEFHVDEHVWHTPEAVANGDDNVVNTAIDWICEVISTEEYISERARLKIYPNPATDNLFIQLNDNNHLPLNVTLYDAQGKFVKSIALSESSQVNVQDLPAGIYLMKAIAEGRVYVEKFVKD